MTDKPRKSSRSQNSIRLALVTASVVGFALLAGLAAFNGARKFAAAGPVSFLTVPNPVQSSSTVTATLPDEIANSILTPSPIIPPLSAAELTPWDGAGRVTILVMGLDYRDWAEGRDYPRSDTMILLTLDPSTKTAGILSVPRDMWVPIPGFKHGKINTAYYLGEAYKLPGGGPALATKTVEQFLGIPINYYAQIDFSAFVQFIDKIGGVRIDVPEKITIDLLGDGAKTKKTLKPGRQTLPGEYALAYARARHTEGGDFDRAQRQQQVILGIRDRIVSFNLLPTLIKEGPALYRQLQSGINTNLGLEDALRLALAAKDISDDSITRGVIDKSYVLFGFSPDNLSILIPLPDKINLLRDQIFSHGGSFIPATPGDGREKMTAEGARLAVFNGSPAGDLGERTAAFLTSQGANVIDTGLAESQYVTTTIIDHTGNPYTISYLSALVGNPNVKILSNLDFSSPVDVEIYLGVDWARSNSIP